MADTAASTQSRTTRANSTKRRANTVSTETENKLARAARSAQRLAQLSDASRDGSTLDMFPDDPTRATLEAMNIDIRQGTLHGFELPDVVLAAVGGATSLEAAVSASSDTRAARRAPREKVEPAYAAVPLDGFERFEPTQKVSVPKDEPSNAVALSGAALEETNGPATKGDVQTTSLPVSPGFVSPSMAASLVRSVTARRQAGDPSTEPVTVGKTGGVQPQRFAETFAKAATAAREGASGSGETSDGASAASATAPVKPSFGDGVGVAKTSGTGSVVKASAGVAEATAGVAGVAGATATSGTAGLAATAGAAATARANATSAAAASTVSTPSSAATASSPSTASSMAAKAKAARSATPASPHAQFAAPLQDTAPTVPELDRARATAFADTVDALYGVISDQRRAATDHSRRMKWMLSIVVGALLATVAIGITQTVLLMRLTRETTAQQHRIEQLMQNQQTAMTSLLDAHLAAANAAAVAPPAAPSGPSAPVVAPRAPLVAAATAPASKHKAHAHAHKPKAAPTH